MPQQIRDRLHRLTRHREVRRKRVPQIVSAEVFDARFLKRGFEDTAFHRAEAPS